LRLSRLAFVFTLGFALVEAKAQDSLVSGPGSTLTENKCKICHELQHIRRTRLSRGEWADNLRNMKERGAPMDDAEMAVILDYLTAYYSRDPAPPPGPDTLASGDGDSVKKILDGNACSGCHAADTRVVGPSFREVSLKYKDRPEARGYLMSKIRQGGQGVWGQVPMPPNPGISDDDLSSLVAWVLQLR
jgi:cytochrome c